MGGENPKFSRLRRAVMNNNRNDKTLLQKGTKHIVKKYSKDFFPQVKILK